MRAFGVYLKGLSVMGLIYVGNAELRGEFEWGLEVGRRKGWG